MHLRAVAVASLLTLAAASALVPPAQAATQPVHLISHRDPFAGCTLGASDTGVNYPSSEVEPWVAVDPHDARRVIGVYQQDRWSDGGARGLTAATSSDGEHFTDRP